MRWGPGLQCMDEVVDNPGCGCVYRTGCVGGRAETEAQCRAIALFSCVRKKGGQVAVTCGEIGGELWGDAEGNTQSPPTGAPESPLLFTAPVRPSGPSENLNAA